MKTNITEEILSNESELMPDQLNSGKRKGFNHIKEYQAWYILLLIVAAFFLVTASMFLLQIESAEDNKYKRLKFNENYYK